MKKFKKRVAALLCAAVMVVSSFSTMLSVKVQAANLDNFDTLAQQVAAEGCVLLRNENDLLPLDKGTKISIFGRSQRHYDKFRVFAGSGDGVKVNKNYDVSILKGLKDSDLEVNSELEKIYEDWVKNNPYKTYPSDKKEEQTWENRNLSQVEMPLKNTNIVENARQKSDVAVVIISRLNGEDCDTTFDKGRYYLQDAEEQMLQEVTAKFDKVVVLLNVCNIMDMSWVEKYGVESVMYVWNGGQSGGKAVADVITGKVNPSGKLADTIAKRAEDYPTYKNYGGSNYTNYEEDIYVGYRYFETFAPDTVEYCFGYGMSYTDFEITTHDVIVEDDNVKVVVSVKNTGDVAGKEVVQVYYGAPQGVLGNPVKELAAFAKTRELEPGETQNLSLSFKVTEMASYDDGGYTGHESAYVLEAGTYKFYVGNSVKAAELQGTYELKDLRVVEQLTEAAAPYNDFKRMKAVDEGNGKFSYIMEDVPKLHTNVEEKIKNNLPKALEKKDNNKYKLRDVYDGKLSMEQFVAQMSDDDLASLLQGSENGVDSYMGGSGCPFGGVVTKNGNGTTTLKNKYGIPVVTCVDGPAGAKIKTDATLMPSGNVIGCTWNLELILELFRMEGQELVLNEVDNLLGPGMNIHRDPRNGRNAEYYSEDPLLTGRMAAMAAKGIQESGATATGKHLACNNQERNRRSVDSRVSERALREIYLKPFEIFVKEGNGRAIMTAYNPVNGNYTAGNYDLNTTIVRNEWGYDGMIMTDWWADLNKQAWANGDMDHNGERIWVMIRSGGDIFMKTNPDLYDSKGNPCEKIQNLFDEMKRGNVTRPEMERSAVNVLNLIIKSQAFYRDEKIDFNVSYKGGEDWFKVEQAELGNPLVKGITVGGRQITSFNQKVLEYKVYAPADSTTFPVVEATAEDGTTIEIEQATAETRTAIVQAKEQQATRRYRIVFTDEENMKPLLENPVYATLSDIKVNGKTINGFNQDVKTYNVAVPSLETEPEITWTAQDGVNVTKTYDATSKTAKIVSVSADQAMSYTLKFGIAPQSDEFEGTEINGFWTVENKNSNLKLADGHLTIGAEKGSIWQNQAHLNNRVIQSAAGDWEAVTKIDIPKLPTKSYQSLGVVAMQDIDNYIYVKMAYEGDHLEISLCQEKAGSIKTLESISEENLAKFSDTLYIKLVKLGNTYLPYVSPDGTNYIRFKIAVTGEYEEPKFMLVNGNGDVDDVTEVLEAKFDYVHFETENVGDTVNIGAEAQVKVGEVTPNASSATHQIEVSSDGGYYIYGNEGGFIAFNIDVEKTGYYDVTAGYSLSTNSTQQLRMALAMDGEVFGDQFGGNTGGDENWTKLDYGNHRFTAGRHTLRLDFYNSFNVDYIQFKRTAELDDAALKALVDVAKQKDVSSYPEDVQAAYAAALKEAEEALANAKTQDEITAALTKLQTAEESLKVDDGVKSITANPTSVSLNVGATAKINVTVDPADYTGTLQWVSENPDVAEVDNDGTVKGIGKGTTNIVISSGSGVETKVSVTVNVPGDDSQTGGNQDQDNSDGSDGDSSIDIPGNGTSDDENNQGGNQGSTPGDDQSGNQGNTSGDGNNQGGNQGNTSGDGNNQDGNQDSTPDNDNQNGNQNGNQGNTSGDGNNQGGNQGSTPGNDNQNGNQNGNQGNTSGDGNNQGGNQGPITDNDNQNGNQGPTTDNNNQNGNQGNTSGDGNNQGGNQGPTTDNDNQNGNQGNTSGDGNIQGGNQDPITDNNNQNGNQNSSTDNNNQPGGNTGNNTQNGNPSGNNTQTGTNNNQPITNVTPVEEDELEVGTSFIYGKFVYKVSKTGSSLEVQVMRPAKKTNKSLVIPATIRYEGKTYKVTTIAKNAFKDNSKLKSITIGKYITTIGSKAFYGCKKLSNVTFKGTGIKSIKSKAFSNVAKGLKVKAKSKQLLTKLKQMMQ